MLLGDFFTIQSSQKLEENAYQLKVVINPKHKIFEGHFPGNPIVPGVCLTQMVKEIVESLLLKKYRMSKAANIKFTAIVNPNLNPDLETKLQVKFLENEEVQAELTFYSGETTFYKFKGNFLCEE